VTKDDLEFEFVCITANECYNSYHFHLISWK